MKILELLIPSGEKTKLDEIESFTLKWYTEAYWVKTEIHAKVFLNINDAKAFKDQLINAAELLKISFNLKISITKN